MILTNPAYCNRPTRAEISIPNLLNNFAIVRSLISPQVKVMAMVKANAYGHGIVRISQELIKAGVNYLGVAYLEEALFLRQHGIHTPILVCGAINSEQIPEFIINDVAITSSSIDKSKAIQTAAKALGKKALVHLKIDTVMERIGVHWYNAQKFIEETLQLPDIQVVGIFSHLAKAESDSHFTQEQITRFESIVNYMDRQSILPPYVHLANSAAIINNPESHFTMVRPGIMLYGYNPNGYNPSIEFNRKKLLPVMTLKTKVSYFKVVPANTGISYNHLYKTTTQTRVVTLPVGYGDGYSRLLSNQGEVIIRGKRYPVVGAICMDQLMVDIGYDGTAYNGDDVLLFGQMDGYSIPLESLCEKIGTITYEVLTNISPRVPRIYIQ